ncbi:MAG: oxidoreductase [Alicyclobacillus sp. RIFOXYA1_FULL_53_8]|nr:MAG: oxidoreductase [Alicyclobacillus sp. RIFOXYA1_FULL_53_8]
MKVGMIGLGDIAEKAYLPILGVNPNIELHIATRNPERLARIAGQYRIANRYSDVQSLLTAGLDAAFVHSATEAHATIVEQLLEAGVHVYVDKPISFSLQESTHLVRLAKEKQRILMVGFNRRFAPMIRALKEQPAANVIVMQKNRVGQPGHATTFILDDFIHVVDTLRFLLPGEVEQIVVHARAEAGQLYHVSLQLSGRNFTAIGLMNRDSGITEESLEYMASGQKWVVHDLNETLFMADGQRQTKHFGDWTPVLHRRGFEQIITEFLQAVRDNRDPNPSAEDSLRTHELCHEVLRQIGEQMGSK